MYIKTVEEENIRGFFTDREGSALSPYMNYDVRRTMGLVSVPWIRTRQIHSDRIAIVEGVTGDRILNGFDAMITEQRGICLVTVHADCVPVQLYDEKCRVIAAVHAGWRGTALGIAGKTAKMMKERFGCSSIRAYIGPAISMCCYEVGKEVAEAFSDYPEAVKLCGDKPHVDLKKINKMQLENEGVDNVDVSSFCTCCSEGFVSYRKTASMMRMASGIYMIP